MNDDRGGGDRGDIDGNIETERQCQGWENGPKKVLFPTMTLHSD